VTVDRNQLPEHARRAFQDLGRLDPPEDLLLGVVREASATPQRRPARSFSPLATLAAASAVIALVALAPPRLPSAGPTPIPSTTPIHAAPPDLSTLPSGGTIGVRVRVPEGAHLGGADATSVWLGNESTGTVSRLDSLDGRDLATVQVNAPSDAAYDLRPVSDGVSVFAAGRDSRTLDRIDPGSMRITARWDIDAVPYRIQPSGQEIWVTDFEGGRVLRVDASTGAVSGSVFVERPTGIAVTPGMVYAVGYGGELVAILPTTLTVVGRYPVAQDGTDVLAVGDDLFIWGINGRRLERFDPAAGAVAAWTEGVTGVALVGDQPWASVSGTSTRTAALVTLDANSLGWTSAVPLGDAMPDQLVASSGRLWVSVLTDEGSFVFQVVAGS
jgi:hypothetical protein